MRVFYFEKLEVWQEARRFIKILYASTLEFPPDERYGLMTQMRRASLSVAANIAEGMARHTEKDKARFINQAFGSVIEIINFLIIANDLNLLSDELYIELRTIAEKITNQLNSLYRALAYS